MEETEVTIVPEGTAQKESTVQNTTQGDQQTAEVASPKSAERSTKSTSTSKHQRKKKTTSGSTKSVSNEEEQDTSDGSEADTEADSDDDANATQAADKSCKKPVGSKKDKGQSKKNGSGKKLSSSKKKSSKESSKKSSKQKKKKKAKDDLSDCDADSSDPSDSDEDSDQDHASGSKKSGLKSQFKALQLQVSQLQQQLSNQASVPAYSTPGYPLPCQYPHSAIYPQTNTSVSQPAGQRSRYGLRESRAAYKTPGSSPKEHLKGLGGLLGGDSSDESDQAAESKKKSKRPAFKRVDQVWDSKIHNFKLQDTADVDTESQYEDFIFHVRRTFDWEGKYRTTYVDIKSKLLRECLQDVIGNTDGVSLVDEVPKLNPHLLFL